MYDVTVQSASDLYIEDHHENPTLAPQLTTIPRNLKAVQICMNMFTSTVEQNLAGEKL